MADDSSEDERRPKKLSQADRAGKKAAAFVEGLAAAQSDLQQKQGFEAEQAGKYRSSMDEERNKLDADLHKQL